MTETWSPQTTYEPLKESIRGAECMSLSLHTKVRFKVLIPKLLKVFNDLTDFSALTRSVLIPTKLNRKENILINLIYFWVVCNATNITFSNRLRLYGYTNEITVYNMHYYTHLFICYIHYQKLTNFHHTFRTWMYVYWNLVKKSYPTSIQFDALGM